MDDIPRMKVPTFRPDNALKLRLNDNFFNLLELAIVDLKKLGLYIRKEKELKWTFYQSTRGYTHARYALVSLVNFLDHNMYFDLFDVLLDSRESYLRQNTFITEKCDCFFDKYGKQAREYILTICDTQLYRNFDRYISASEILDRYL